VDNGSASRCVPQAAEDSDYDDVLENWDDEDAGERNRGPTLDESGDEVFSCSLLALGCPLSQTATRHTTLGCCLVVAKATAATNIYCCGVVFFSPPVVVPLKWRRSAAGYQTSPINIYLFF
jgi:hypothetical protein